MRGWLISTLLSFALYSLPCGATEKTVVFNHVSGQRTELDDLAHKHFGKRYEVVDFTEREHTWVYPKGTWKPGPSPSFYVENRCVPGSVLVLYIISSDGSVIDPYVVKATNPLLADPASRRMAERRFQPGQLDERFVSSLAATNIRFACEQSDAKPSAF